MEYVEKKYEVRVFYIDGESYCLATFSQGDPKTEIDYRRYNKEKPNRNASFLLPGEVQMKLNILMKSLGLKTGSIDLIVTPDDEFVFLEVNPVGQFLNIEELGNYNLCGKIAGYLTKVSNANKEMNGTIYN
jgi:glutathione synthase/RimK-type ligase-like ATP-grasp enzyme